MDIIRFSIRNPVTVIVGVILIVLFGAVSLMSIPIQLSPSVEEPEITVRTVWPGATPYEIERDIIEEQEKVLKGIPGLDEMESVSRNNYGSVDMDFDVGTDLYSPPNFEGGLIINGRNVAMKIGGYVKADFIYDFDPIDETDSFEHHDVQVPDVDVFADERCFDLRLCLFQE